VSGKEFIGNIFSRGRAREAHYLWRPQLRDLGDELVPEAAVNVQAEAIVTFNKRDFGTAPARFGVVLLSLAEPIRRFRR
jgi:hypothetical protein